MIDALKRELAGYIGSVRQDVQGSVAITSKALSQETGKESREKAYSNDAGIAVFSE